jgi:hypothetical protein
MEGLRAYKTYNALLLHMSRDEFDGWKYNFTTRVSEASFSKRKDIVYQYAKIERDYPTVIEQLKLYYPFMYNGGMKFNPYAIRKARQGFKIQEIIDEYLLLLESEEFKLLRPKQLLEQFVEESFTLQAKTGVSDHVICIWFILTKLNSNTESSSFVYDSWKMKIEKHSKFIKLYLDSEVIADLSRKTLDAIQKLSR